MFVYCREMVSCVLLQVWCSKEQERNVEDAMKKSWARVERHHWWMVKNQETKKKVDKCQTVQDDIMPAFVGYKMLTSKQNMFDGDVGYRSRMVIAPPVPKTRRLCDEELPGYLAQEFFERHSREGDHVADLMCGSGSASVAAASIGRHSFAVDVDTTMVVFLLY
jgi:hypothetical protein